MQKNLVIVESPAKAKTIEKFLGNQYKVLSSYGHIRDLIEKGLGVDTQHNYQPEYVISPDKEALVKSLKKEAKAAETVWLASDEDREGEAIAWHLFVSLGLSDDNTRRIVFHEITKNAILNAIENPRGIDYNLVNAQQARRVLDRIVGFELSPILWKKIRPALSAGRVQSVAVRLIVEREREINHFQAEASYRISAIFLLADGNLLKAELDRRMKTQEEAYSFLEQLKTASFTIEDIVTKPAKKSPAAPFTTSTLQQEAARKMGFSVSQTMTVAQRLYESGYITYMRTDSVNLSALAIATAKKEIEAGFGHEYVKSRQFQTKTKGAQEAHEAIRPSYMDRRTIKGSVAEQRLYELIWKRMIASQMADAELERTTVTVGISNCNDKFYINGEVVKFDGFLRVYMESKDDEDSDDNQDVIIPPLKFHERLTLDTAIAAERLSQRPYRYSEASLVRKMEELGIGRPSTYAPTISTIQNRGYVVKANKPGEERKFTTLTLKNDKITSSVKKEIVGADKGKLAPTDTGLVVNDFLIGQFPTVLDYSFTANIEKELDKIAEGDLKWTDTIDRFYKMFHPIVEATSQAKNEFRVGERVLGNDPKTGKLVSVKIGRYGPYVQLGHADDEEKPLFASLMKDQSIETITLEEALKLFTLPRHVGDLNGSPVTAAIGRFGPFLKYDNAYVSIPKGLNPISITIEEAERLIIEKKEKESKKLIQSFDGDVKLQVLNGRFGPYIAYDGANYKLPKGSDPQRLTLEECMTIVRNASEKATKTKAKTTPAKRKTKSNS
ncbi:MAG: type I DNA topoisomerase [Dysgonamonadaceae bacterium]|jgi:DNA topoisomerase-1|nr:type I DNA topoisomerase [Dysgonamonadaceae bacterium]